MRHRRKDLGRKCHSTVARGAVPREFPVDRRMARDRPSPYVKGGAFFRLRPPPVTVARGPVPREFPVDRRMARDRPSPYGERGCSSTKTPPVTVARGPVPRDVERFMKHPQLCVPLKNYAEQSGVPCHQQLIRLRCLLTAYAMRDERRNGEPFLCDEFEHQSAVIFQCPEMR